MSRFALGVISGATAALLLKQSALFNGAAKTVRTLSGAGNRKTWTYSAWLKPTEDAIVFFQSGGSTDYTQLLFAFGKLFLQVATSSTTLSNVATIASFVDYSSWYHVVYSVDTTLATAADRVKIYVNGSRADLNITTQIGVNVDTWINSTSIHRVSSHYSGADYEGRMARVELIDGAALSASDFGETDDDGFWNPKVYSGSYGDEGVLLEFATNTDYGSDTSGNSNDYTDSGFATTDQSDDVPTNDADNNNGNFITFDPNKAQAQVLLTEGNLNVDASDGTPAGNSVATTFTPQSGKWYFEGPCVADAGAGVLDEGTTAFMSLVNNSTSGHVAGEYENTGSWRDREGGTVTSHTTPTTVDPTNDRAIFAVDLTNNLFWTGYYDDSTSTSQWCDAATGFTGDPAAGTNGITIPSVGMRTIFAYARTADGLYNFGATAFSGTPPTDFLAINTANLPASHPLYTGTIAQYRAGVQVQSDALGSNSLGNTDQSMRVVIPASAIVDHDTKYIRLKLKAASSEAFNTSHLYFGTNDAGGSNAWDFAGDQVQVKVNGSGTISVPAGGSIWSDWFAFVANGTDPLLAAWLFASSGAGTGYAATTGHTRYYKTSSTSSTDASATSPSGFTAQSNYFMLIEAIEVQ